MHGFTRDHHSGAIIANPAKCARLVFTRSYCSGLDEGSNQVIAQEEPIDQDLEREAT